MRIPTKIIVMLIPMIAILLTIAVLLSFALFSPRTTAKVINHPALLNVTESLVEVPEESNEASCEQA